MTSLSALLEQSKRLQSSLTNPSHHHPQQDVDLPSLHLGFEQIEQQSRRVASRSLKENGGAGGNAAYLLASGGVNADLLSTNINNVGNLAGTFEPLVPLSDTDVEGYLRHTHEQAIISAIEENRRQTTQDFYHGLDTRMRRDWERQKEKLFEELGRHQPLASGASGMKETPRKGRGGFEAGSPSAPLSSTPASSSAGQGSLQMHAKMMRYDRVIRRLNDFRKEGFAFGLINALGEASVGGGSAADARSTQLTDAYSLLSRLLNEHDVLNGEFQRTALQERQYAAGYLNKDQESDSARQIRRMVADGARGWLEDQFLAYVEKTIASRPAEANLGGVPSVQNKVRAFLNVRYGDGKGGWKNPALEVANGTPLWARIYYLLRSGHPAEALKFAEESSSALSTLEKSFLAYFKAYLDSPTRRLPKLLRDRFLAEYNQRIRYLTDTSDPYKHALYKLIGRVEIQRRNVPGVTQTTEDWLWFQLSLVRESEGAGGGEAEAPHEKYGLRDLAAVLRKFGEQHFDPKGTRPLLYFQVLLLSGQFERAIAFLAPHPAYHADAVHFAIALAYYGVLRVPAEGQAKNGDGELLVDPTSPTPSLSFSRLLHRYTRLFARTDAAEALQYLYLICLSADTNPGEVKVAQGLVRELVMETRQYGALLGDVRGDGTKVPGQIERDLKLLHLPDSRAYLLDIVKAAASRADLEQRFSEAILLYNLAEEYDAVISVLNVELGNSLSRPSTTSSLAGPTSVANANKVGLAAAAAQEDVVAVAKSILEHYDRSAGMGGKVSRKRRETCECLMRLKEGLSLYEKGDLEAALATIESTSLLPLSPHSSSDLVSLIRQAEALPSLDDALVRNLDVVLVATMTILYKLHQQLRESPYGADGSRVQKMEELRARARGVMMFAGMLRYRLTNDTYSTLTKLDVYLN
ncbi:hypothetical protein JCM11251_003347 [Rhodosporidiobolus azoricus]